MAQDIDLGISWLQLDLTWRAARDGVLLPPYRATTMRGVLGNALRWVTCDTGAEQCTGCPIASDCTYGSIWEPVPRGDETEARYRTPPAPYVVTSDWTDQPSTLAWRDTFSASITLFADALGAVEAFVAAAALSGRLGFGAARHEAVLDRAVAVGLGETVLFQRPAGFTRDTPPPARRSTLRRSTLRPGRLSSNRAVTTTRPFDTGRTEKWGPCPSRGSSSTSSFTTLPPRSPRSGRWLTACMPATAP